MSAVTDGLIQLHWLTASLPIVRSVVRPPEPPHWPSNIAYGKICTGHNIVLSIYSIYFYIIDKTDSVTPASRTAARISADISAAIDSNFKLQWDKGSKATPLHSLSYQGMERVTRQVNEGDGTHPSNLLLLVTDWQSVRSCISSRHEKKSSAPVVLACRDKLQLYFYRKNR